MAADALIPEAKVTQFDFSEAFSKSAIFFSRDWTVGLAQRV